VQYYSKYKLRMNCVEHLKEYKEIELEKEFVNRKVNLPPNWPNQGSVEFVDYTACYRTDLKLVLQSISFKINSSKKFSIVS
jgi:ABC-type multidrug transport system fused ATPase/permease subunit